MTQSNSIANSYTSAMDSYTAKSNSIVNSYNAAINSYNSASTAVSQANQAAQDSYNIALSSYQSALTAFNAAHPVTINADGLDTNTVTQAFNLASDEHATLTVESLNSQVHIQRYTPSQWSGFGANVIGLTYSGGDFAKVPINGPIAKATWSNMHGSSYGNSIIKKMVITFSDSKPTGNLVHPDGDGKDAFLDIWQNPTQQLFHSTEITAKYEFYDENNQLIDFKNNDAWLSIGSLNTDDSDQNGLVGEAVKLISGGTAYAIKGSSIKLHSDGWLWSDYNNFTGTGLNNGKNWDQTDSPNAYYGACVFKIQGPSITLRYGLQQTNSNYIRDHVQSPGLNQAWATAVTTIPKTPGPTPPPKPTLRLKPIEPPKPDAVTPPTRQNVTAPTKKHVEKQYASATYHSNKIIAILNHSPYQPLFYLNNKTKNIMNFHNVLQINYFLLLFTYSNRQPHNLDFGLVNGFPSDNRLNKLACVFNFRRASATDS